MVESLAKRAPLDVTSANADVSDGMLFDVLTALPHGVVLYDADGTLLFANTQFAELSGTPIAQLFPGADVFAILLAAADGDRCVNCEPAHLTAQYDHEFSYTTRDGRPFDGNHRHLGDGRFMRCFVAVGPSETSASTDEQQARQPLLGLQSGSLQGILVHVDGEVVHANERLAHLLDFTVDEMIGQHVDNLIYPDDLPNMHAQRAIPHGSQFEFRARRRDGSALWLEAYSHIVNWQGQKARQTAVVSIEERKEAERTLRESEARLRDFAEAGSDWFWETDADHRFTYFSENMSLSTSLQGTTRIGKKREELIEETAGPDDLDAHRATLMAREPFKDFIYRTSDANGTSVWIRASGIPVRNEQGTFCGYRGTGSNVTHEIEYQAKMRRDQEQLLGAINNAPTGVALYGPDDHLVFANEAYRGLDPVNRDIIVPGLRFEDLLWARLHNGELPDAKGREAEWIGERMELHRNPGPPIILHFNGNVWWLISERRLADGSILVLITDVTAEKRAEQARISSENRFREMVEGSVQSIIIHRDGNIIYANDAALRMRGYQGDELIGKTVFDLAAPEERPRMIEFRDRRQAGLSVPDVIEYRGLRKDGSDLWLELVGRLIEWEGEPAIQITEIDITERFLTQEALRQAKEEAEKANRTKSQFLANMSHELRTPLNAIVGFSDMIEHELLGPIAEQRYVEYAHDIKASGEHLLDIINDILDLSRIEAGQIDLDEAAVSLHDVYASCQRLVSARAQDARLVLRADLPADLPAVVGDARRIKQILLNLLSNAVKFTPEGGHVSVSAAMLTDGSLRLSVTDTGIGMAKDEVERALQPFVQLDTSLSRKFEGTGLGLSLSRTLAELHQAYLSIESTPGEGTVVSLVLPPERVLL